MALPNSVYDDADQRTRLGHSDDLGVSPDARKAQVDQLETQFNQPSYSHPAATDIAKQEGIGQPLGNEHEDTPDQPDDSAKSKSPDGLKAAETAGSEAKTTEDDDHVGTNGFVGDLSKLTAVGRLKGLVSDRRKGVLTGGGIGGIVVIVMAGAFFVLIPLKIEHIVDNLETKFFSTTNNAVDDETNSLFKSYIQDHVMPSLKKNNCGTTLDKDCNVSVSGSDPISNLYKSWSESRLEYTLAQKYGIEITYNKSENGGTYHIITKDNPKGDIVGEKGVVNATSLDTVMSRSDVRAAFSTALENETELKQVLIRYKVRNLLDQKYGIKSCVVYCGTKDALTDNVNEQKYAAKLFLVERVIAPRNAALGSVIGCLLNTGCDTETTQTTCAEADCDELAGTPETNADADVEKAVGQATAGFGSETAASLVGIISDSREAGGFQNYVLDKILTQIFSENVSSDAVPVVGQLQMLSQVSQFVQNASSAPNKLKKLTYITNAESDVSLYEMYSTYADEIHTGHVNLTEEGSFTDSLSSGDQCDAALTGSCGTQLGGTSGAEGAPLYSSLIDDNSTASSSPDYLCANGKPVPSGSQVCPEEVLGQSNAAVNDVGTTLKSSGLAALATSFNSIPGLEALLNSFSSVTSWLSSGFESAFEALPFTSSVINEAKSESATFFQFLVSKLVASPISDDMSGGRTFDLMAAGADVAGNDSAHTLLGGQALSSSQVAQITSAQETEAQQQFNQQPFFARIFSTSDPSSLVSKLALGMPLGSASSLLQDSFATLTSDPFGKLLSSFSSIFSNKVSAQSDTDDAFGVTQYGYTQADLDAIGDPETYWNAHCSDNAAQGYQNDNSWNTSASQNTDANTGMPLNTTTDPCLLLMTTIGAAGATSDTSNLTPEEVASVNPTSSSSAPSTATSSSPGNAEQLAQEILSNKNIDLSSYSASVLQDVQDAAAGKPGTAGAMTSAPILQLIETIGETHKVLITAIQSGGQGHCNNTPESACPNDPHYTGNAVDFGSLDDVQVTGRNAPSLTIIGIAESVLPTPSAFGQSQCGTPLTFPTGFSDFQDTCNHLHVQDIGANGSS
jgi:hypothetical protein